MNWLLCCSEERKYNNLFLTFTEENACKIEVRRKKDDRLEGEHSHTYYNSRNQVSIVAFEEYKDKKLPIDTLTYTYNIKNDTLTLLFVKEGVNDLVATFARVKTSGNSSDNPVKTTNCEFLIGDWVQEVEMKSMPNSEWRLSIIDIEGTLIFKTGRVAKTSKDIPGHETRSEGRITCTDNIP